MRRLLLTGKTAPSLSRLRYRCAYEPCTRTFRRVIARGHGPSQIYCSPACGGRAFCERQRTRKEAK